MGSASPRSTFLIAWSAGTHVAWRRVEVGVGTASAAAAWNAASADERATSGSAHALFVATTCLPTSARVRAEASSPSHRAKPTASGLPAPSGVTNAASTVRYGRIFLPVFATVGSGWTLNGTSSRSSESSHGPLMTTAAWVPAWASCSIRPTTVAGGVQITASSGTAGRSATRA